MYKNTMLNQLIPYRSMHHHDIFFFFFHSINLSIQPFLLAQILVQIQGPFARRVPSATAATSQVVSASGLGKAGSFVGAVDVGALHSVSQYVGKLTCRNWAFNDGPGWCRGLYWDRFQWRCRIEGFRCRIRLREAW